MLLTLALGSNLGDRTKILANARRLIGERLGEIIAASTLLQTKAWGVEDQPDFVNQVIVVDYPFSPTSHPSATLRDRPRPRLHKLLDTLQNIELELGLDRSTKTHWGPRAIDIDIIFLGDLRYEDERLSLPHPWWRERDFVGGLLRRELAAYLPPEFR